MFRKQSKQNKMNQNIRADTLPCMESVLNQPKKYLFNFLSTFFTLNAIFYLRLEWHRLPSHEFHAKNSSQLSLALCENQRELWFCFDDVLLLVCSCSEDRFCLTTLFKRATGESAEILKFHERIFNIYYEIMADKFSIKLNKKLIFKSLI